MSSVHIVTAPKYPNEHTYYLYDENKIALIDPGVQSKAIIEEIQNLGINSPEITILLTHAHYDHIAGVADVCKAFNVKQIFIGHKEEDALYDPIKNISKNEFKSPLTLTEVKDKVRTVKEGDKIHVGKYVFDFIEVPGHTIGSLFILCHSEKALFTGDSLWKKIAGETRFPGGNEKQLIISLERAIKLIPDDYILYPGHFELSTVGVEKQENIYLNRNNE